METVMMLLLWSDYTWTQMEWNLPAPLTCASDRDAIEARWWDDQGKPYQAEGGEKCWVMRALVDPDPG